MTSAKRTQVEENIYKYKTNGGTRYMVRLQSEALGHSKQGFLNIDEAREYLKEIENPPAAPATIGKGLTLRQYAWITDGKGHEILGLPKEQQYENAWWPQWKIHLKRTTKVLYAQKFRDYIFPEFGDDELSAITRPRIKTWLLKLVDQGLATETIHRCLTPLSTCLSEATEAGLLDANPCSERQRLLKLRKRKKKHNKSFSLFEVIHLLETCQEEFPRWYPMTYTLFGTGLRPGEAYALEWTDVFLGQRYMEITKNFTHGNLEATPKDEDLRVVPLDCLFLDRVPEVLSAHREAQELEAKLQGAPMSKLVFPNLAGSYIETRNFHRRVWYPLIEATNESLKKQKITGKIQSLPPKFTRHTWANLSHSKGMPLSYVQDILGHSSITVTMDNYGKKADLDMLKGWLQRAQKRGTEHD